MRVRLLLLFLLYSTVRLEAMNMKKWVHEVGLASMGSCWLSSSSVSNSTIINRLYILHILVHGSMVGYKYDENSSMNALNCPHSPMRSKISQTT